MNKFKSKPKVIEAYQITKEMVQDHHDKKINLPEGLDFKSCDSYMGKVGSWFGSVRTIHGQDTRVTIDDWIIAEPVKGRFYPCKPDIFTRTYDAL